MNDVLDTPILALDTVEEVTPDAVVEAMRPLVSALNTLVYHADQVSHDDDPRDPDCDAAQLLSDAEAVVYGLANAPSTDYFWQVASTQMRAALRMVHRTLQQALDEPEGLGIAQMAMLPAAITLAGRVVAVLDLVEPDEQLEAVRELETALRTGALIGGAAPAEHAAKSPEQDILGELHELLYDYAQGWHGEEEEALNAVACLCEVGQSHVATAARHPDKAVHQLQEGSLAAAGVEALLSILHRVTGDKALSGAKRLASMANEQICEQLAQAQEAHPDGGPGQH